MNIEKKDSVIILRFALATEMFNDKASLVIHNLTNEGSAGQEGFALTGKEMPHSRVSPFPSIAVAFSAEELQKALEEFNSYVGECIKNAIKEG